MRHGKHKIAISRGNKAQKKSTLRNLVDSLILHGFVNTTIVNAKATKPVVDRLISYAKTHEDMTTIRYISKYIFTKSASRRVITELKDRYKDRTGGFCRIIRTGKRVGDGAVTARIELI